MGGLRPLEPTALCLSVRVMPAGWSTAPRSAATVGRKSASGCSFPSERRRCLTCCGVSWVRPLQLTDTGPRGPPGVGAPCPAESASSLGIASVLTLSALAAACRVWDPAGRIRSASRLPVTVGLSGSPSRPLICTFILCPCALRPRVLVSVDGGWGQWSDWTKCSKSCGGGVQSRRRECDSPSPDGRGSYCEGLGTEVVTCNTAHCPGTFFTV